MGTKHESKCLSIMDSVAISFDNSPLTFEEFEEKINQAIYVSATPGPYELEQYTENG